MEDEKDTNEFTKKQFTKLGIIKNLLVISLSFVLIFTAYDGLSMMQSTMNKENGIGTISQGCVYIMFCIGSLLFPKYAIKKFGCKLTIIYGQFLYMPYIAANFYPHWATLLPTAVIIGLAASLIWGAQSTYFNEASVIYCSFNNENSNLTLKSPNEGKEIKQLNIKKYLCGQIKGESSKKYSMTTEGNYGLVNETFCDDAHLNKIQCSNANNQIKHLSENTEIDVSKTTTETDLNIFAITCAPEKFPMNGNFDKPSQQILSANIKKSCIDILPANEKSSNNADKSFQSIIVSNLNAEINKMPTTNNTVVTKDKREGIAARFFGLHGLIYQSAQIWSNLLSYHVLSRGSETTFRNSSCGAMFCANNLKLVDEIIAPVDVNQRILLTGVCVTLALLGVASVYFLLDPLDGSKNSEKFSWDVLMATFRQCKTKEQLYFTPMMFYLGVMQGFYTADFTKAFIGCTLGTSHVGRVTVYYGLAGALSASLSGWIVKHIGRIPVFLFSQILFLTTTTWFLHWEPHSSQAYSLSLAASLWGIIMGILWTQIPAFCGILFKENQEAAFACFYTWDALGWFTGFLYSDFLCTATKIYILIILSLMSALGYLVTENLYAARNNNDLRKH